MRINGDENWLKTVQKQRFPPHFLHGNISEPQNTKSLFFGIGEQRDSELRRYQTLLNGTHYGELSGNLNTYCNTCSPLSCTPCQALAVFPAYSASKTVQPGYCTSPKNLEDSQGNLANPRDGEKHQQNLNLLVLAVLLIKWFGRKA